MSVPPKVAASSSYLIQAQAPARADAVAVAVVDAWPRIKDRRRLLARPGTCRRRAVRALPRPPRSCVR